jgi:hypothetical protein
MMSGCQVLEVGDFKKQEQIDVKEPWRNRALVVIFRQAELQ